MITLSKRLQLLADAVPNGCRVVDVGTDHAKLAAYLSLYKQCDCLATDIHPQPLQRAATKLQAFGAHGVRLRLGDGLTCILPDEVDTIVIAGMGGETIAHILESAPWAKQARCLLQPASKAQRLRRFLDEQGYGILEEDVVFEETRWYPIIHATTTVADAVPPDAHFVSYALRGKPNAQAYIQFQIRWLSSALPAMEQDTRYAAQSAYYKQALVGLQALL